MQSFCTVFPLLLLVATTWAGELRCLRPGASVISLYKDNRYFPGRLDGLGESIDVTFQNGQQQTYSSFTNDVIVDDVPDVSELAGESRVLARRPSSISFEPGFVNGSIEGLPLNDTFLVNYDTGDSIARNIQDIRLAVKPRSCMNEKGIYIGCFENVVNNFLTNYYPVNPTDVATCNWACFTRGFRFAGVQNGTWCFCGNHVNDSLKVDDNDCNIACRDSREDVCGGYQRMTVYWTGAEYNDNNTSDLSAEFPDTTGQLTPEQDLLKSESSTESACSDIYDSSQCNTWADQSKCIENPDWMIANCKKSCYACGYNDHNQDTNDKADSSFKAPVTSTQSQSQVNMYQSPAQGGYQTSSDYAQSSYPASQDSSTQSSAKKSDHPVLDNTSNTPGYLGCFRDSPSPHDLEYLADIRPVSIRACVTKCKSMRFPYAGVQSSSSCYCGLHYGEYGQLEHEDCNTPCEADSSEMCGGLYKNSLYQTGFPVKFKSAESALTRKNLPSSSLPGSNVANSRPYQPNPSSNHPSQYPQSSYPQPIADYTPPVYPQPASPYTQAAMPGQAGYPQTSNTRTNGYQPAYTYNNQASRYNNQASNPVQSGSTNADTRDYSPADSSSYRWRETYVKLRQQEQERYSKPNLKNLRKLHKSENTGPRNLGNSIKRPYPEKDETKGSSKFKNLGNNVKTLKETREHSVKSTSSVSQSLYKQLMSQVYKKSQGSNSGVNRKILRKGTKPRHKQFGKPGVFLRKKASKKNSFLAFLPHEVTENESLLENVYNMLSVMLKNLRKHKKSSLKNLKKYLKLSKNNEDISTFTRKAPLHAAEHKESVDRPEKPAEQKFEGTKALKPGGLGSKAQESSSSRHKEMAKSNRLEGQKQLSKPEKDISNPGIQMTYASRDGQVMTYASRVNANQSLTANENSVDSHQTGNKAKPAVNLEKGDTQSFTKIVRSRPNDVGKLSQSQLRKNVSSKTPQVQTRLPWQTQGHAMPSEVRRNMSEVVTKNEYQAKPKVSGESKSGDQKVSVEYENGPSKGKTMLEHHHANVSRIQANTKSYNWQLPSNFPKLGKTFEHNKKQDSSFENQLSGKNANLERNLVKSVSPKTEYTKETLNKEKLPTSKTGGKANLKTNTTMARNQTHEDNMEGRSDEDIISTIVDMIEKEKAMRKMKNHSDQREQNDSETKHSKSGEKRKNKRHSKKGKHKKGKSDRKHKLRHSRHDNMKNLERIYKKDHIGRVIDKENDDENLMAEDEDFRENNGNESSMSKS